MTTEIAGVVVRYEICGEGEPVLLLHGWGGSVESFLPLTEYLKKTRQVILLDFPGHGQSGEPQTPWAVEDFAGLVAELLRRLGVAGCDMLGHSFGGRVAIVLAAKRPQLVKKLVLVDAAGILPRRGISYYAKVYRYKLGKKLAKIGPIDRLFHLTERQKNAGSAEYRALSGAMRATFVRVVNEDLEPLLPQISAETLLVWGSEDTATPLSDGQTMERKIPNAGLVVFEGCGHFSYLDDFPRFCAVLKCFLEGLA